MDNVIKKRLEELIALLKDPEVTVAEKEMIVKLEKIVGFINNPDEIKMEKKGVQDKLEKIVALVNDTMIDLNVDVDYCIPEVETTSESCDISGKPHILLTYTENEYTTRTRKVSLGKTALQSTPEDLTKHVILAIEEFKDEMDDIQMG